MERGSLSLHLCQIINSCQGLLDSDFYTGDLEGFVPMKHYADESIGVAYLLGYLPSDETIYVAFRAATTDEALALD